MQVILARPHHFIPRDGPSLAPHVAATNLALALSGKYVDDAFGLGVDGFRFGH